MKRWLVSVALLLSGFASLSYADYVLIRAILGGNRTAQFDPNQPGGIPAPGFPSPGIPSPGIPSPGIPSPGIPSPGGPPRGEPGIGSPDGGMGIPMMGGGQTGEIDTAALAVQAIVKVGRTANPQSTSVKHKWSAPKGSTRLYNDDQTIITRKLTVPTSEARFKARENSPSYQKNRSPTKQLDLGAWALEHGLVEEFAGLFDNMVGAKEDQTSTSKEVRDAVKAYATVKAGLEKAIDRDEQAQYWKGKLSCREESSKHYVLLYTAPVSNPPEVQSRLAALEDHMRAFYYWWALKGLALPMPDQKLVAVLLDSADEFRKQRVVVEDEPLVTDGFYANRDHIVVFSAHRLDLAFNVFTRQTDPIWRRGFERARMLDGSERRKVTMPPFEFARYQTLALLERALEDEAERASVTHEGSRQLFVATALIPRSVVPPQWAQFGTAAFFETPKGLFPGAPASVQTALHPGVGAASWVYLRPFKEIIRRMEMQNPTQAGLGTNSPADLLRQVITDGQFNTVLGATDRTGLLRARTTAWALSYYLMKARLPGMGRYIQEIAALPRDLEVDAKTLRGCFARAFDVANATSDDVDPAKFEELAKNWVSYMKGVALPGAEYNLELPDQQQGQPGQPGQPGGPDAGSPDGGTPGRPGGGPGGPNRP
jgi:hypothetical protein